jgi:hypothetical protein
MDYWQDNRQRFKMTIESNGKRHEMQTEREGVRNKSITYNQTQPPPIFREHTGKWEFEKLGDCVRVTLTHRVIIDEAKAIQTLNASTSDEAEAIIRETLRRNGATTMEAIKDLIEGAETSMVSTDAGRP